MTTAATHWQGGLYTVGDLQTRFGPDVVVRVLDDGPDVVTAELGASPRVEHGAALAVVLSVISSAAILTGYALALLRPPAATSAPASSLRTVAAAPSHVARPPVGACGSTALSSKAVPVADPARHGREARPAENSAGSAANKPSSAAPRSPRARQAATKADQEATDAVLFSDVQAVERQSGSSH